MASITFKEWRVIPTTFGELFFKVYLYNGTFGGSAVTIDAGAYYENPSHLPNFYGAKINSNAFTGADWTSASGIVKAEKSSQNVVYRWYNTKFGTGWYAVSQGSSGYGLIISNVVIDNNGNAYPIPCPSVAGSAGSYGYQTINNYTSANNYQLPTSGSFGYVEFTGNTNSFSVSSSLTNDGFKGGAGLIDASYSYSEDKDPYSKAGDSDVGGGGGSWDDGSDPVPIPSLPNVGAVNTGFISLFVPTLAQLRQVADYLWSPLFDVSTFYKIFENPMDCILGLSVVPVSVPTSGSAQITVGNIELSGITLPVASQQYVEVNCGTLHPTPYFGSYLDYEPYTKMSLFVPYSGVHTINADDVMNKDITLVYHIDILTGSLVAYVKCGDSVLYEFNGACGSNIPVNSMNYASTIENAIRIAVNIGTTVATAGASAPATVGTTTATSVTGREIGRNVALAGSTAEGILSLKPNIDRAGSLGGTTGLLGNQTPYLIITRPRLCKPSFQSKYKGYPAFITYSVEDLIDKGYTEFDTIILEGLYLTDEEKNELETILQGGVYL